MTRVYHYTSFKTAEKIRRGADLVPRSPICIPDLEKLTWFVDIPRWAKRNYIFCLPEGCKEGAWEISGALQRLFAYIGAPQLALLELSLSPACTRTASVVEGNLLHELEAFNAQVKEGSLPVIDPYACVQSYLNSRVPLSEYQNPRHKENYLLPEIIVSRRIPSKHISVIEVFEVQHIQEMPSRYTQLT